MIIWHLGSDSKLGLTTCKHHRSDRYLIFRFRGFTNIVIWSVGLGREASNEFGIIQRRGLNYAQHFPVTPIPDLRSDYDVPSQSAGTSAIGLRNNQGPCNYYYMQTFYLHAVLQSPFHFIIFHRII